MNTRSFIFFTRILARAQISSMIFRGLFYWGFIGHNFGDYKNRYEGPPPPDVVLSVTILETTKTTLFVNSICFLFYRSQFWRLQKQTFLPAAAYMSFIGHNFGDYKNLPNKKLNIPIVLSVTILETTKTCLCNCPFGLLFYRSQFWRLQKPYPKSII